MLTWLASYLHAIVHPASADLFGSGPMQLSTGLVLIPSLVAAVCPAFFLTNVLVYLIAPARHAMEAEDRDFPGTSYKASQLALLKLGLRVLAVCTPIILAGALLA